MGNIMIERFVTEQLLAALSDRPSVFISGARQVGKSTLALHLSKTSHPADYFTFDDLAVYSQAKSDPAGFIAGIQGNVIFDEIQRVPELFYAIKSAIDRDRTPGRFLLTGSANIMVLPELSDALVGRVEIIPLGPLAMSEILGTKHDVVDQLFSSEPLGAPSSFIKEHDLIAWMTAGGYPEIQTIQPGRKTAWFDAYLSTIIQRDLRDLSNIQGLAELPRLLRILAGQTGQLINFAGLSRSTGIEQKTLKRYLTLLQGLFIIHFLPAWFPNIGKRMIKTPKLYFHDTGIQIHLQGQSLSRQSDHLGHVLENFILTELMKQISWSTAKPGIFYYRTAGGSEVDIILEHPDGRIVAIEVKSRTTLKPEAATPMKHLRDQIGQKFHRGIVLYLGEQVIPIDQRIHAVPVSAIFTSA